MHDLRQLRHFVAIAENGNFARAAEAVNLTQPALSRSLQALERTLSCQLLNRSSRGVSLTTHGHLVIEHARTLLIASKGLKNAIDQLDNLEFGELLLGGGPIPSAMLIPRALGLLITRHAGVRTSLIIDNWMNLREQLLDHHIELYVADVRKVLDDPMLQVDELFNFPVMVFCQPHHPLLECVNLSPERIGHYPLACTKLPSCKMLSVGRLNARIPPVSIECDNFEALYQLIRESSMLGLAPWDVLADHVSAGRIAILPIPRNLLDERTAYGIVSRRGEALSPAAVALKIIVQEENQRTYMRLCGNGEPNPVEVWQQQHSESISNAIKKLQQ
ncbi:LysR family transcriptional regulator [Pseudomonas chlororaphis]|uniref:LysR family transcriptional regulator n=1 Tax=Pseudomonas chlororaphis TaxID=587753 RepID=UPI0015DF85A3|nr:LysR family transcriptional regulator [Pseudomonas chlororaphis]QLL11836.1 LysR family transcriptional regulator [Pseudomonas chlororaphis subsp. aurantiaca]